MTETITLKLTLEELKTLDKYVELNDETRPLFDKIRNAYPKPETLLDVIRNLGYSYDCCYEIVDAVEEFQKPKEPEKEQQIKELVKESVKWCEEHPDENPLDWVKPQTQEEVKKLQEKDWEIKVETDYRTGKARHKTRVVDKDGNDYKPEPITTEELLKPKWEPKPQSEEEVAEGLRNAMKQAKEDGVFDEPKESWMDKPIDELVDKLMENPPDCLKFQLGKTLEQIITRWWEDTFTTHKKWSVEECIDDIMDQVELWFPREQSSEGSQDIYAVVAVETHNDLLKKIKSKLRNKKDT